MQPNMEMTLCDSLRASEAYMTAVWDSLSCVKLSAPSGVCGRANARSWANRPVNPQHPGPAAVFFSASGRLVLPLSFSFGLDRGHAHSGGARNRRMAARMARTIGPVTATSASWQVMARAWRTTRAPIFITLCLDVCFWSMAMVWLTTSVTALSLWGIFPTSAAMCNIVLLVLPDA